MTTSPSVATPNARSNSTGLSTRLARAAVPGAVIAGIAWAVSGVAALIDPGWDSESTVSTTFYVIEGSHAVAETAMIPALLGLWSVQRGRLHRPGRLGFTLAVAATALMAAITYPATVLPLLGVTEANLVAEVLFLLSMLGTIVGFLMCGIATIRARVWPAATGLLLIAYPLLVFGVLALYSYFDSYRTFIGVGLVWLALARILATRRPSHQTAQPA